MLSEYADFIGLVAAALTTGAFSPQIVRTWRRGGEDLSYAMLGSFFLGVVVWLLYGLITRSTPVIAANLLTAAQVLALLVIKRTRGARTEV